MLKFLFATRGEHEKPGARVSHKLAQMRTKVLNNELEGLFRQWYPSFRTAASGA